MTKLTKNDNRHTDALLLSMGGGAPGGGGAAPAEQMDEDPSAGSGNLAAMTEEEQIALAIQMSMAESAPDETMEGLSCF